MSALCDSSGRLEPLSAGTAPQRHIMEADEQLKYSIILRLALQGEKATDRKNCPMLVIL